MALRVMAVTAILVRLMVVAPGVAPGPSPSLPITCSLPTTLMISADYCNADDERSMVTQTQSCEGFLTDLDAAPDAACCLGINYVAYNRTACVCKMTFYPPAAHNASRQLDLPRLCGVRTDLCGHCPVFLKSPPIDNGTHSSPVSNAPYSDGNSTASTVGAISLAVIFGLLLVAGAVFGILFLIKKQKAKNNPPQNFEAPPPGGAF